MSLRFIAIIVVSLALAVGVVLGQSNGEKTWEDAMRLYEQAMTAFGEARFQDAIELFEDALVIAQQLGQRTAEAQILNNLGNCCLRLSDYKLAIDYLEQSLAICREIGDRVGEAFNLTSLGDCYRYLSDYQRAIDCYEQSLMISREIGDRAREAGNLGGLGSCHNSLSDYQRAIYYFEQALEICWEIGYRAGEAACLTGLGNCHYFLSDYQQAIDYLESALVMVREIADRLGEAMCLSNLGNCYIDLSDYQRAIDYHEQSLAIKREIGDRLGEAASLNGLGLCYYGLLDYQRAIDHYEQSLLIKREIEDRTGEAICLNNLASCYESISDHQRAISYYEQSLVIKREIGDRTGEAICLNNLGHCYFRLSDYDRAFDYLEQALALSVDLGTPEVEWKSQCGLGRLTRDLRDLTRAVTHYEAAIEIVESIRGTVGEEELRQSYFGSVRTLYEEYLELLLEMGRNEETVFVAERLRARTFLDALYQSGLAPEQLLLDEVGIARSSDVPVSVMDAGALEQAVDEAQGSLLPNEAVIEYMVGDDGIYLWVLTSDQTLGPEFIPYEREQLLRDVVALRREIEPQSEESAGGTRVVFSDPTEALGTLYELLVQPALTQLDESVDTLILVPSGPLWYVPFAALVMTDRPEIQVGGPAFAPVYRPTYLIDEYTLAFLPSLASLPMLMEADVASTGNYLAFANPVLSEEQQTVYGPHYQYGELETACQAFATYVEGSEADIYMQSDARESLAYSSSTGQRVLMYACHGEFNPGVPLASRLLLAPSEQDAAPSTDRRLADGNYHASEVLLTDHRGVDLVVLAACETLLPALRDVEGTLGMAEGPESDEQLNLDQLELIVAGDEVVGLARSFLSSGANSVLATLWQANPRAIEKLLVSFGEQAQAGMTWGQALRQAQRVLIANDNFDDVWFWAPYQLIGRWR